MSVPCFPRFRRSPRSLAALMLSLVMALGLLGVTPRPARADLGDAIAIGIIGGAIICGTNPEACKGNSGSGGGGGGDAMALNRTQAMWVQEGLQNLGFYSGVIDGALGAGSRASIRQYQAAIGDNATGVLTGKQINDLVALSPSFVSMAGDEAYMFNADIARDVDSDQMRQIQAQLNAMGYAAGPVDGAFGGKTQTAIAAYKATQGLPGGPVPSRRLMAHMMGWEPPVPAGVQFAAVKPGAGTSAAAPSGEGDMTVSTASVPPARGGFDLNGVALGMSRPEMLDAVGEAMAYEGLTDEGTAPMFGGGDMFPSATLAVQSSWPDPMSEEVVAFTDPDRPEEGVLAIVRMIRLPETVDQAAFEAQILPGILSKYGDEARVGDSLTWISDPEARARVQANPAELEACGALLMTPSSDLTAKAALWSAAGGPSFVVGSPESITADCGEVLKVSFEDHILQLGLWNSSALVAGGGAVAPAIKF